MFFLPRSRSVEYLNILLFRSSPCFNNITMMQQRLVPTTRAFLAAATGRSGLVSLTSAGRTADPKVHGEEVDKEDAVHPVEPDTMNDAAEPKPPSGSGGDEQLYRPNREIEAEPFTPSKSTPYVSSPRLESVGVNHPLEPNLQQKKRNSTTAIDGVSCVGLDGSPWPREKEEEHVSGERREEDNVEYFKHHKASPLAELEIADTRKPISRATDGAVGGSDVIVWLPEQLDTAEESLLRASRIWRESAMRGDPDAPQSRVLRALRGEI